MLRAEKHVKVDLETCYIIVQFILRIGRKLGNIFFEYIINI